MVNDDAPLGIEDEIVLHARKREIAAELAAMIDRGRARRQDFDHDDGIVDFDRVVGSARGPQTTDASGSYVVRASIRIAMPSG